MKQFISIVSTTKIKYLSRVITYTIKLHDEITKTWNKECYDQVKQNQ